ncbi:MAG: DUF547 domain-containing protein [Deltaproteobacteria bacterium]
MAACDSDPVGEEPTTVGAGRNLWTGIGWSLLFSVLFLALGAAPAAAAPKADPWSFFAANDPASRVLVDHGPWDRFLKRYVVADHPSGIHRVRYASVTPEDRRGLDEYLRRLQGVEVTRLNRSEQKAYWIDLYNALTVRIILDNYPVKSIREIDISPGFFSDGPWGAKLLTIQGQRVSLDDIEHRILRPLWKDNRIHYAVNCASLGCPNLQPEAYTSENTEALLEKGAREYVNHPRGVRRDGDRLHLSSIYKWFLPDFGGSEESVVRHLLLYAEPGLAERLKGFRGNLSYGYDWRINEP